MLEVSNRLWCERQVLFCDLLFLCGLRSRLCYSIGCFVFSREGTIESMDDSRGVFVAVAGLEFFLACVTVADVQTFETVDFRFRYFGMISTWLILPVVIRLSQRLSHACLSISNFVLWNCEWLIISVIVYSIVPYYLDNRSNSRANTCINTQLLVGRVAFIRLKPMQSSGWYCVES